MYLRIKFVDKLFIINIFHKRTRFTLSSYTLRNTSYGIRVLFLMTHYI